MLPEDKRIQLDGIVQKMVQNKESDDNIRFVVDDFKSRYTPIEGTTKKPRGIGQRIMDTATGVTNFLGLKGMTEQFGADIARARAPKEQKDFVEYPKMREVLGSAVQGGALLAPGVGAGAKLGTKVLSGALTGYGLDVGSKLQNQDKTVGESFAPGGGTVVGATLPVAGKLFNLAKKATPPVLSFTSGVPQKAIDKAITSPKSVQVGRTNIDVEGIRQKSVEELKKLYTGLSDEFSSSLDDIVSKSGQTKKGMVFDEKGFKGSSEKIREGLAKYTKDISREFGVSIKNNKADFSKSAIVKSGETANFQKAIDTISTWKDFSAKGMQDLAERIGALRKFESGAKTQSSAVLGKLYNKIAGRSGTKKGLIPEFYPELETIRTNFSKNKKMLDNINDILRADKNNPVAIQSSITRLSNLFKEDKNTYLNLVKELSRRSGVDIEGLLAGTEFKNVLPNFVRGLGGAGVVGVGSAVLNPYLLLLAPLFSPRAVGKAIELGTKSAPLRKAGAEISKKILPVAGTKLNQ